MKHSSDVASLIVAITGGLLVVCAYIYVFKNEREGYVNSRFWIGIPPSTASAIIPLQVIAAIGFILFVLYATGILDTKPTTGVLSYLNGYSTTILLLIFFASSVAWPITARYYLDKKQIHEANTGHLLLVVTPLVAASISSVLFTAGAFEADMHPVAVVGILMFSAVVVLADGVGWNAKLILSHYA